MSTTRQAVTRLTLDMRIPDYQRSVTVTEGDVNRRWEITLIDGGRPFPVPLTWKVALAGVKSDGTVLYEGCVIDRGGRIIYDFASGPQIATCLGAFSVRFDLYNEAGDPVASPSVWVNVMPGQRARISEGLASTSEFTILSTFVENANALEERVTGHDGRLAEAEGNIQATMEELSKIRTEISDLPTLPPVTDKQNGHFLRVVDGKWKPITMGELPFYYVVRFYNDDKKTVLYEATVPMGGNVLYAGNHPVSALKADSVFSGFEPSPTNVTSDMDCYAMYEYVDLLNHLPWSEISSMSNDGTAENYFAVGDTKTIHVEGTVGILDVNDDFKAYILGFDHNKELEGGGITFGTFKDSNGRNVCLVDSDYGGFASGEKTFSIDHINGNNHGGWAGCDMRYDILGSTDIAPTGYGTAPDSNRQGNDPSPSCATNPVKNTLMAALPEELRHVIKPMHIFTDNIGGATNAASNVTSSYDYLPLLSAFELSGKSAGANQSEQDYQSQYAYFKNGGSHVKYSHVSPHPSVMWWLRSVGIKLSNVFQRVDYNGGTASGISSASYGLAPIFRV